ncbi:MAG: hypothetical protein H7Z18_04375 [Methylophilaceae bacterium]|nr:hypothetical protein [Methylophilaceae bacterium]
MRYQFDIFLASLNQFWLQLINFMPKLLAAIVIIFFGWLLAMLARVAVRRLLELMHFDKLTQKSGLEAFMSTGNIHLTLCDIVSHVVFWLVIVLFIITGADTLGLTGVADLLHQLANYLPHIILAILVMVFGTLLARFVNKLVFAWLYSIKVANALVVSTSAEYCIQILAIFVSLEQLGFGMQLIYLLFLIIFGSIFLALALAFGLGGREWASKVIQEATANKFKK